MHQKHLQMQIALKNVLLQFINELDAKLLLGIQMMPWLISMKQYQSLQTILLRLLTKSVSNQSFLL